MFHVEPNPSPQALAETVVAEMHRAGLVQRTLSEETGIPLATLNRRLKGYTPFLVTELDAIARTLGTTGSSLMARAERGDAA